VSYSNAFCLVYFPSVGRNYLVEEVVDLQYVTELRQYKGVQQRHRSQSGHQFSLLYLAVVRLPASLWHMFDQMPLVTTVPAVDLVIPFLLRLPYQLAMT
jgi:hypothetical protein